ncbi:MAG: creatininase [Haloferacaceae archaeon]
MTDSRSVEMGELTWEEFDDHVDGSVVFVPVGSTEQHGPHLPLNVDTVIATEFSRRVARRVDGLVAPPLPYGFKSQAGSGGGADFTGTTNLDGETLRRLFGDVVGDLVADGATKIVAFNGHFENEYFLREAVDLHLEAGDGEFIIASWWDLLSPDVRDDLFSEVAGGFPGWATEHAGVVETALMQHFRPELVRDDRIVDDGPDHSPPYVFKPARDDQIASTGAYYKATYATPEMGERVVDDVLDTLVEGIAHEWSDAVPE